MSIISSGIVIIGSGVTSSNLEVIQEGSIHILENGRVRESVLADGGTAVISSGGILYESLISSGGTTTILNSGYAQDITVEEDGLFLVSSEGTAHHSIIKSGATQIVYSESLAVSSIILDGGFLYISSGGYVRNPVVSQGGFVHAESNALADSGVFGGQVEIAEEAAARFFIINGGGNVSVFAGGFVFRALVSSGGTMNLFAGGVGDYLSAFDGGIVNVDSAGEAYDIRISGGTVNALTGAQLNTINVNSGGSMVVFNGASTDDISLKAGGRLVVSSGGVASGVTWTPCEGIVEISDGAEVTFASQYSGVYYGSDNTLLSNALSMASRTLGALETMCVMSGGTSIDTTVGSEGRMDVFSGGKLTGKQIFENGAIVSMCGEAVLDFDLTRTEAGKAALVNDLSVVCGTPVYTLTVSDSLGKGVYALAAGAAGFSSILSVVDTGGAALGSLTVGETIQVGDADYTLNLTDSLLTLTVVMPPVVPTNLVGTPDKVSWDSTGSANYIVEYSMDDFGNALQMTAFGTAVDMYRLPTGTYQWRIKADDGEEWAVGNEIVSEAGPDDPKAIRSNEDGNSDLFFASANGTWDACYYAQHVGSINDWTGTNECVSANGKGKIQNLFFGSSDSNVLCLTDGENGDAIFVDDVYTELPEEIGKNTARLYRIQEIRAGAGDDIVDMTSQQFEYTGEGLTIHGGEGNDTIWASKGKNVLFGDVGNDRIVGASLSDVIAGGIGNDRMHGGGGDDVFSFCNNWGNDTVEQLAIGTVTLWFASGSLTNWDANTMTYTDGDNSVKVSGVTAEQVSLKFGDDGSKQYATLSTSGAFAEYTSRKIFEVSGTGILASL